MNRIVKTFLILIGLLSAVLVATMFRGKVTEVEARQLAVDRFVKVCAGSKLDRGSFDGPILNEVGGVPYAFEWSKKPGEGGDGILITVDESGATNVSFVPGWAINPRSESSD